MHSRARGKSKSKRPLDKKQPSWVRYKPKEVEMLVVKMAKEGMSPSKIGLVLRDSYGVPDAKQVLKKTITKFLKEKDLGKDIPEDLMSLIKRSILLKKHLEKNHKDMGAKRGLQLTESKIKRLVKYYKRSGRLPETWKFQPDKIRLYVE